MGRLIHDSRARGQVGACLFALLASCAHASLDPAPDGGTNPACGNGDLDPGEACDDGNQDDADACTQTCEVARCGDGVVQLGVEACDDGNQVDDDACSNACAGWQYRAPITFDAPAAATNVPILVVLDATSFAYPHAAPDGADLRLGVDDDASNGFELPYWIEAWDAAGTSRVWARVPSVVAGTNTIYVFYGHSTGMVATTGDFAATFPDTLRTTGNVTLGGPVSHDAVIVEAGHTVTVTAGAPLAIAAGYVKIDGTINANAAGFAPAMGPGPGGPSTNAGAGGGGHGGAGGAGGQDANDTPGPGGTTNGDLSSEMIEMGSGGGTTDVSTGGRGGGAVSIEARRIVVTGAINARGQNGPGSARSAGGGAGGGVMLRAASLEVTGALAVDGGTGGSGSSTANDGGGGGGGGRIKLLHAGELVDTGTSTLTGGAGGQFGDTSNGRTGSPGTKHAGTSATLSPLPTVGPEQHL